MRSRREVVLAITDLVINSPAAVIALRDSGCSAAEVQ